MKAVEFISEEIDVYVESMLGLRDFLRDMPHLFENSANYMEFKEFVTNAHKNSNPKLGQMYSPLYLLVIPVGELISLISMREEVELINHANDQLTFLFKGSRIIRFPNTENKAGDKLTTTLLFDNNTEKEEWLTLLRLRFGHWRIKEEIKG